MGVPKRRTSKANYRSRRANWKIAKPTFSTCPQCHATKLPHHVCPECGYYKGKEVVSQGE